MLNNLGNLALGQRAWAEAQGWLEESLGLCRDLGDRQNEALVRGNLGLVALETGRQETAREHYAASLEGAVGVGDRVQVAYVLGGLAALAAGTAAGARLAGAATALLAGLGTAWEPVERGVLERTVAATRARLGEAAFAAAWGAGQGWSWEQAVAEARATGTRAPDAGRSAPSEE